MKIVLIGSTGYREKADEVHVIWDGRSVGTVFDFGMAFALRKPIKIVYIEPKTITGVMKLYAAAFQNKGEGVCAG